MNWFTDRISLTWKEKLLRLTLVGIATAALHFAGEIEFKDPGKQTVYIAIVGMVASLVNTKDKEK